MGASASVWEEIKRKANAKGGNPASPRNPKTSVRQAASIRIKEHAELAGVGARERSRGRMQEIEPKVQCGAPNGARSTAGRQA